MPFDSSFEIKVGQIDVNELSCELNSLVTSTDLMTYMSKVDIVPRDCDVHDILKTINALPPFSSLLLRNKDLPIVLKWDSNVFNNECLDGSMITDWHPGAWFDAGCEGMIIAPLKLVDTDSVVIDKSSGIFLVDSFGDTLSMFHIALGPKDFLNSIVDLDNDIVDVFPNPTNRFVNIKSELVRIQAISIYNYLGLHMGNSDNLQKVDLHNYDQGVYFIR